MFMETARRQIWRSLPMFGFRTRNPKRDHQTDLDRYNQLISLIEKLHAEMVGERTGMQTRYRNTEASAAFAMEALENGDGVRLSEKVDELTLDLRRYHARISSLDKQVAFIGSIEQDMKAFLDELSTEFEKSRPKELGAFSRNVAVAKYD